MSRLSSFVRARVEALKLASKDVARRIYDLLGENPSVLFDTVAQKLSKLMTGDPEGERFFFPNKLGDPRPAALAGALECPLEQLDRVRAIKELLLDPGLDPDATKYLVDAEGIPGAVHVCLRVGSDERLRQTAQENPGVLVVLADLADAGFYEGAKISVTTVVHVPKRGWQLVNARELVPLPPTPPPPAPDLFDGTGAPMLPCDALAEKVRSVTKAGRFPDGPDLFPGYGAASDELVAFVGHFKVRKDIMDRVRLSDQREQVPTFRLEDELGRWLDKTSQVVRLRRPAGGIRYDQQWTTADWFTSKDSTLWWVHGQKVFAMGADIQALRTALAPHHAVHEPEGLDEWRAGLARWNPWRLGEASSPAAGELARVRESYGLNLLTTAAQAWAHSQLGRTTLDVEPLDDARIGEARAVLAGLATRGVHAERASCVDLPLVLEHAARAPLRLLRDTGRSCLSVRANLGAGRLVQLRVARFPEDEPRSLAQLETDHFCDTGLFAVVDGGDVRLWVTEGYQPLLEGTASPGRNRRELQATRDAEESNSND